MCARCSTDEFSVSSRLLPDDYHVSFSFSLHAGTHQGVTNFFSLVLLHSIFCGSCRVLRARAGAGHFVNGFRGFHFHKVANFDPMSFIRRVFFVLRAPSRNKSTAVIRTWQTQVLRAECYCAVATKAERVRGESDQDFFIMLM